jgi:sigma-E factor negative regulatory protein RseC
LIEERGQVVEVRSGRALVETVRSGSCEACGARHACGCTGGGREARVWVDDPIGVRPGERVTIAVSEGTVLRASVLVYLLPVVALVIGAIVGNAFAPSFGWSADLGAAGLGLGCMVLAFVASRYLGGRSAAGPTIVGRG